MTTPCALNNGGVRYESDEFELRQLPDAVNESGEVYNFTVYDDRIYFLTCEGGSDILPGMIFSCDMDGSDMTLLAVDASNYSSCCILYGYIYYDVYPASEYDYFGGYSADYLSRYASGEIEQIYTAVLNQFLIKDHSYINAFNSVVCSQSKEPLPLKFASVSARRNARFLFE